MKRAACLLLFFLLPGEPARAAALDALSADGWYTWRVAAADGAPAWCCTDRQHEAATQGCNLDSRRHGYTTCESLFAEDGHVQLYAKIESGVVTRLRALSPGCPVRSDTPVSDLGTVEAGESFDWLRSLIGEHRSADIRGHAALVLARTGADGSEQAIRHAMVGDPDREVREQAVFALSQLPGERAVDALLGVVEDRGLDHELRKTALFWLVQSESDRAFASVERLLSDGSPR